MKKYLPEEIVDMLLEEWGKEEDEDTPTARDCSHLPLGRWLSTFFASITTAIESHGSLLEKLERTIDDMTPVIMERRAQVKSLQQQVTELRSSQGKRGKTQVAKDKTSHPRSRFHNPDTCSRKKTTITSFIRHSRHGTPSA
ncbi:hypothetical protein Salat_2576700 [Sesamum alatum]|uniref:Uncharacterized protein n=1 Tax=Sesamum alatum TaxID=300844 RepID=A0AAE1XMR4_9LAMI|nr:hypothetical protein Salat_2576700 [Sesamum alatum]